MSVLVDFHLITVVVQLEWHIILLFSLLRQNKLLSTPSKTRGRPPGSKCPYDLSRVDVEWLTALNKSRHNKGLMELEESTLEKAISYIENKVLCLSILTKPTSMHRIYKKWTWKCNTCMLCGFCTILFRLDRAKNFHSSARPRRALFDRGWVDFSKHLLDGTSRIYSNFFSPSSGFSKHLLTLLTNLVSRKFPFLFAQKL